MYSLNLLLFAFVSVFLNPVQGKGMCDLSNIQCTSKGVQNAYKIMVSGVEGIVQPSDPIFIAELKGELETLQYQLFNVTLTGLKNCQVLQLTLDDENLTFREDFFCSKLVLNYTHEAKGLLDLVEIDGRGVTKITLRDYKIIVNGTYDKFISKKDQQLHFLIDSHTAEFDTNKEITIEVTGPLHPVESKSETAKAYIRQNTKEMEKMVRTVVLKPLTAELMSNIDTYLRNVPAEEILPAEF